MTLSICRKNKAIQVYLLCQQKAKTWKQIYSYGHSPTKIRPCKSLNLTAPKISFNCAGQQLHMNGDNEYDDDDDDNNNNNNNNNNGETTC
jgi:hypothetical protein